MKVTDTIAAIATGSQVAAIGIVRVSGDLAVTAADHLFVPFAGKPLREQPDRKLVFGELHSRAGHLLDLCLCTVSRGPASYTGEDTVEFQCHGSPMLLQTLMRELFEMGVRQAGPGEFTKRAFLNGRMDLSSAEAVIDLIDAESEEAVRNAAGQLSGTIHRIASEVYDTLADISAHFYAVLDYPDEDIEEFRILDYCARMENALRRLRDLLKTFERGSVLKNGIPTAIIGLPNAGKSSLMNALLGYERAIVTDIPGTTRDTIEERIRFGGVTLRLIDTAGIHTTDDPVEQLGIRRSMQAAAEAGLVIAVIDGSAETDEELRTVLQTAENAHRAVVVLSKADLPQIPLRVSTSLPTISISALTGEGLDQLEAAVSALYPEMPVPAGEILTNARQADAVGRAVISLQAALEALRQGMTPDIVLTESEQAMQALGELTGSSVTEDITNKIFSRFCVGK